ncbi:Probable long-chain-alcohol O-fatty-acyltransferase 5 [Linum grandiflorum]
MEDNEVANFIKVWTIASICLSYAYFISSKLPKGIPKLISLLPVFYLFFVTLPLSLHTIHLVSTSAFFLVWLASSNLLLFSFDLPPLSPPPQSLFRFISLACFPIKLRSTSICNQNWEKSPIIILSLAVVKFILLIVLFNIYDYRYLMRAFLRLLYLMMIDCCINLYYRKVVLALCTVPARALFGFELELQFDKPYLATSLQEFWGRRWNLVVSNVLRPTVYVPVKLAAGRVVGRRWASLLAVVAAFVVSGLMHELLYYYMNRVGPTWEVTWFFVIHGVCVAAEVAVKKKFNEKDSSLLLPAAVSGPLTVGFVGVTAVWLLFPQILRNGAVERVFAEYEMFVDFLWSTLTNFVISFS